MSSRLVLEPLCREKSQRWVNSLKKIGAAANGNDLAWLAESYAAAGVELSGAATLDGSWPSNMQCAQAPSIAALKNELQVDLVHLVAVPEQQYSMALELLSAGCDVVLTLPAVTNAAQVEDLLEAAAGNQGKLFWLSPQRFDPAYVAAKEQIDQGSLGRAAVVRTESIFHQTNVCSVAEALTQDLDFLSWCFGSLKRIFVRSTGDISEKSTPQFLAVARMDNGVIAHLHAGFADQREEVHFAFEISFRDGMIVHDSRNSQGLKVSGTVMDRPENGPFNWLLHKNAISRGIQALANNQLPKGSELALLMNTVEAATDSMKAKKLVTVEREVSA